MHASDRYYIIRQTSNSIILQVCLSFCNTCTYETAQTHLTNTLVLCTADTTKLQMKMNLNDIYIRKVVSIFTVHIIILCA